MAHRIWKKLLSVKRNRTVIHGSLAPAGAGSPTDYKGNTPFGISRSNVGRWQFSLDAVDRDRLGTVESVTASLQLAAAADRYLRVHFTNFDPTFGAGQQPAVVIQCVDSAGADQEIAADANNRVNFSLVCVGYSASKAQDLETVGHGRVVIQGSFAPNGASSPLTSSVKGDGVLAVTRQAVGLLHVACPRFGPAAGLTDIESAVATYEHSASADYVQVGSPGNITDATFGEVSVIPLRLVDGTGAAVDRAVGRINFKFVFKNTVRA